MTVSNTRLAEMTRGDFVSEITEIAEELLVRRTNDPNPPKYASGETPMLGDLIYYKHPQGQVFTRIVGRIKDGGFRVQAHTIGEGKDEWTRAGWLPIDDDIVITQHRLVRRETTVTLDDCYKIWSVYFKTNLKNDAEEMAVALESVGIKVDRSALTPRGATPRTPQ